MEMPDEMSFVPTCAACTDKRQHTPEEWRQFHPWAGHGFVKQLGWSHPEVANLPRKSDEKQAVTGSCSKTLQL